MFGLGLFGSSKDPIEELIDQASLAYQQGHSQQAQNATQQAQHWNNHVNQQMAQHYSNYANYVNHAQQIANQNAMQGIYGHYGQSGYGQSTINPYAFVVTDKMIQNLIEQELERKGIKAKSVQGSYIIFENEEDYNLWKLTIGE